MIKPLILSTYDTNGGAALAAYRLHQGLLQRHVPSTMLVRKKTVEDASVLGDKLNSKMAKVQRFLISSLDRLPLKMYFRNQPIEYSLQWVPDNVFNKISEIAPDIINIHWVNNGFLQIETLNRFSQPLVWTLHDMWPFTGGCHYAYNCDRYMNSCGSCPQLKGFDSFDLSRWVWNRKNRSWGDLALTIITPSSWLAECARKSSLFNKLRVEVIPNGLDIDVYKPVRVNRSELNLPEDKQFILFGAMNATSNPRKGFHLLQQVLGELGKTRLRNDVELLVFGSSQTGNGIEFGFKCHYLGKYEDSDLLAQIYSAADVFVAPSIQDNLPNTVIEAMACGTPCVAFDSGGMVDLVDHKKNGYLAKPFDIQDFVNGISWILHSNSNQSRELTHNARKKVEKNFTQQLQAERYLSLFIDVLEQHKSTGVGA